MLAFCKKYDGMSEIIDNIEKIKTPFITENMRQDLEKSIGVMAGEISYNMLALKQIAEGAMYIDKGKTYFEGKKTYDLNIKPPKPYDVNDMPDAFSIYHEWSGMVTFENIKASVSSTGQLQHSCNLKNRFPISMATKENLINSVLNLEKAIDNSPKNRQSEEMANSFARIKEAFINDILDLLPPAQAQPYEPKWQNKINSEQNIAALARNEFKK